MDISRDMIDYYLQRITSDWFDQDSVPPKDVNDYKQCVVKIAEIAARRNDMEPLRLGLDYLLCHSEVNLENHGYIYPYTDAEVRHIVKYLRETIFGAIENMNCDEIKDVRLVENATRFDWWSARTAQGLHPPDLRIN